MKFDMASPCKDCPFRHGRDYLTKSRRKQIADVLRMGGTFACHKTVDYSQEDEGAGGLDASPQHCAGALIVLEREGRPGQLMRIAERLGVYDRAKLDMQADVHRTLRSFVEGRPPAAPARRRKTEPAHKRGCPLVGDRNKITSVRCTCATKARRR